MIAKSLLALVALPALVAAHFQIVYPAPRTTDDGGEATYPCAGAAVTENRTTVSATSLAISLDLEHTHSLISILLSVGNEGSNFTHLLQPTVQEQGPGDFCFPSVPIPADLNITDGTNGTIQVITDGESSPGLYMCADVTFTTASVQGPSSCSNSSGLTASAVAGLANSSSSSHSASGTSSGATTSATGNAAAALTVGWSVLGAAVVGAAALL